MGHHAVQAQPRGSASSLFPAEHRPAWSSHQVHKATADPASPFHTRWCSAQGPLRQERRTLTLTLGSGWDRDPASRALRSAAFASRCPHSLWGRVQAWGRERHGDLCNSWPDPSLPGTIAPEQGARGEEHLKRQAQGRHVAAGTEQGRQAEASVAASQRLPLRPQARQETGGFRSRTASWVGSRSSDLTLGTKESCRRSKKGTDSSSLAGLGGPLAAVRGAGPPGRDTDLQERHRHLGTAPKCTRITSV